MSPTLSADVVRRFLSQLESRIFGLTGADATFSDPSNQELLSRSMRRDRGSHRAKRLWQQTSPSTVTMFDTINGGTFAFLSPFTLQTTVSGDGGLGGFSACDQLVSAP